MSIEIGSLVVKGRFGPARPQAEISKTDLARALAEMRRDIMDDVRDVVKEASRRTQDR